MSNKLIVGNSGKTAKNDRHGSINQPTSTEINAPTSFDFLFGSDSFILSELLFNRESNTFNPMNSERF
uniref:Candidate secreted effector n=1 Tax=Meloidogyne incognita TaxID=6306 RepID=A0A914L8R2_MELIC